MNAQDFGTGHALAALRPDLTLHPQWLSTAAADRLIDELRRDLPWEQHRVRMFGRDLPSPRLSCWIGDPGTAYTYSRTRHEPHPWPSSLQQLRAALELHCAAGFNSVLANWYRNGGDSMGWHADDEPELGPAPVIASLSLGVGRRFLMRQKDDSRNRHEWRLQHGDLLLMRGDTQARWQHSVPKEPTVAGERVNLTFRRVRISAS